MEGSGAVGVEGVGSRGAWGVAQAGPASACIRR